MGSYERDDPAIAAGRSDTEKRNLIRCINCGTPWAEHTPDSCSRHAYRPAAAPGGPTRPVGHPRTPGGTNGRPAETIALRASQDPSRGTT